MKESQLRSILRLNPDLSIMADGTIGAPVVYVAPKMSEFDLQTEVFRQCAIKAETNPAYNLVLAIPNGQVRPGQRIEPGLKRGVPDIAIFAARHSRHGCFIELKISPRKQEPEQLEWQRKLRIEGYICSCIWDDPQKVIDLIEWYLEG